MKYTKQEGTGGAWVKASEVESGSKCKLVAETVPSTSEYEGKTIKNNVSKIRFAGEEGEARNVNVNKPSINALIDAFGDDSKNWTGNVLTAHTEKMLVGGKRVTAMYLIPEGYSLGEDSNGYLIISRDGEAKKEEPKTVGEDIEEDINPDDIPF